MSISFYNASVNSYLQVLESICSVLDKGAEHAASTGTDPQEYVMTRLSDDMMPLHFQVVSVVHHSLGAIQGMQKGVFSTPSFDLDMDYAELTKLVVDACATLREFSEAEINSLSDENMVFRLGTNELPFTNQNFLLSFSLPNFYFHATTVYDILRMLGVPLGKRDYLGNMKMGV
jgi:uncharacterized protein